MMINCTKLKATVPESTCIARQDLIKNQGQTETPGLTRSTKGFIIDCSMCIGCETGLKFFKERVKMEQKKCSKCGQTKNVDLFYKNASSKDHLQNWCKKCMNFQIAVKRHSEHMEKEIEKTPWPEQPKPMVKIIKPVDISLAASACPVAASKNEHAKGIPTQVCSMCKRPLPLTAEFFHVKKDRVNGFRHECKECRSKYRMGKNKSEARIILDLTDMPDLLEKIQGWSKNDLRDPDKQIIYFLKKAVEAMV